MSAIAHDETVSSKGILSGLPELRDLPDWFREQQHAAWEKFESIPPQDYFSALTHLLFGGNQKQR